MNNDELISLERFLDKKGDFSHLLVHLTRRGTNCSAKDVLFNILKGNTLKAYNPWCIYINDLAKPKNASLREYFKVVCFTETPLDQIGVLLQPLEGRRHQPEPYGLVFRKSYIRANRGNPVFYTTREIAKPLGELYERQKTDTDSKVCKLLALMTLCEEKGSNREKDNDWHWEREWRVVGDLIFDLRDIYCGLCPEQYISYFRDNYKQVPFIDPYWGGKRILDELVKKELSTPTVDDIPF